MAEAQLDSQGRVTPEAVLRYGASYPHNPNMEGQPGFVQPDHTTEEAVGEANMPTIAVGLNDEDLAKAKQEYLENPAMTGEELERKWCVREGYFSDNFIPDTDEGWGLDENRRPRTPSATFMPNGKIAAQNVMSDEEREALLKEKEEIKAMLEELKREKAELQAMKDSKTETDAGEASPRRHRTRNPK